MKITLEIPDDTVRLICAEITTKSKKRIIINKDDIKNGNVIDMNGKAIEKRPYTKKAEETR